MILKTLPFDAADALDTPEEQAALLAEAFASGEPTVVTAALSMIARARGVAQVSLETVSVGKLFTKQPARRETQPSRP